LAD
jgi:hypothetical protein